MPGYFLNDFNYAKNLIGRLALPNVKLQFDIFHRQILHGDITSALKRLLPIIGHVQIASVPARHEPGTGELNDDFVFAALEALNYAGFIGCEYNPRAGTLEGLDWFRGRGAGR
jgi:hydroxypyruvate isomerase